MPFFEINIPTQSFHYTVNLDWSGWEKSQFPNGIFDKSFLIFTIFNKVATSQSSKNTDSENKMGTILSRDKYFKQNCDYTLWSSGELWLKVFSNRRIADKYDLCICIHNSVTYYC